jgi:hypothetical protein
MYLGISGVLHPSRMLYELLNGRTPEEDGHQRHEAVQALGSVLLAWPQVRIVLTSAPPWAHGLPAVPHQLGPLASRVLGHTFEDITTKVPFGKRHRPISEEDYWRLSKSSIVLRHVEWLQPARWIAVEDEGDQWPEDLAQQHLVRTDGSKGLLAPQAMDRLVTVLKGNFGEPVPSAASPTPAEPPAQGFGQDELRTLETVAVRRTPIGVGYILFADLNERAREQCWRYAAKRRGLLRLPSGEDAVFFGDYKLWIESLGGTCPED